MARRCSWRQMAAADSLLFSVVRWVYLFTCILSAASGADKFTYLGCYADSNDLKDKAITMATLTLEGCAGMCQRSGYAYAGLQEGRLCYCGQTYDVLGKSLSDACNMTCGSDNSRCGGHLANDVYYTVDSSGQLSKSFVLLKTPSTFRDARMKCVGNNGDLVCPTDSSINSQLIASVNDSSIARVWIGLYRKDVSNASNSYDWTDETLTKFKLSSASYSSYWVDGEKQLNPCVSLVVASGKWQSTDCSTALPFFCKQPPVAPGDDSIAPTDAGSSDSSDGVGSNSKRLALFIVLPLFILCYGGSCILYCVHKIIKNCNRKKQSKMMLGPADDAAAQKNRMPPAAAVPQTGAREKILNQQTPPYRPLSAAKRVTVYPAPQASMAPPLPSKFPMYMDAGNKVKSGAEELPAPGDATARSVKIAMPDDGTEESPPPKYVDRQEEKRARLLENAARESRMRRDKDAEDGRPASRPFTAPKRQPPSPPSEEDPPASENQGSTTNLLGKPNKDKAPPEGSGAGGSGGQSMAGMSINEILKMKVTQKNDKKRPRKIVAA